MGSSSEAVERELVRYGRELAVNSVAQLDDGFTTLPEANQLLESSADAFLLGLLFTQGIPAERAWAGPYLLKERLGTLELDYLAENPDAVRAALQMPPMLHRFKETLPTWISSAAVRLIDEHGGDAANIWRPGSSVLEVIGRLSAFRGIGRKKAVMAAELLDRHFGVSLSGREHGQVAYDVQARRVFLRAGLVDVDSREAMEAAAARACPDEPAVLDLPAWLIGRQTCRPKAPLCGECRLRAVCPRRVWLNVEGVGAQRRS